MNVFIPWWGPLVALTVFALVVANWWPDKDTGISAAAGGFIRAFFLLAFLAVMWIGALVWRLWS